MKSVEDRVAERQPIPGSVWRTREKTNRQTRHVIDRTSNGDVIFVRGQNSKFARRDQCSITDWNLWARNAVQDK